MQQKPITTSTKKFRKSSLPPFDAEAAMKMAIGATVASAATTAQNIIHQDGALSIEFRKATGKYLVHEIGAASCTFAILRDAVDYLNERWLAINASAVATAQDDSIFGADWIQNEGDPYELGFSFKDENGEDGDIQNLAMLDVDLTEEEAKQVGSLIINAKKMRDALSEMVSAFGIGQPIMTDRKRAMQNAKTILGI